MPQISVSPVYGAGKDGPLCSLLKVDDDLSILLDCGWDDMFRVEEISNLAQVAPQVTHVLISHPDLLHLGCLPYAKKHFGLDAPVYATLPVHKMGQMYLYDQYLSRQAVGEFSLFSLDDVDAAFAAFQTLQYSQTVRLSAKGKDVSITPFNAGHLIGGTVWRINVDGEEVVYAVDINHRKDRHLNGASLDKIFDKPALMVTSGSSSLVSPVSKQVRDREFLGSIMEALRNDGNVLLPVDTAGRVLELICLLEKHWHDNKLASYQLVLLTSVAYNTMEFAKSQLEWMNTSFTTSFEHSRTNAFSTRYMKVCHSRADLAKLPRRPKVVMASLGSMESGPARELLADWAQIPQNLVIFTQNPVVGSLAYHLQTGLSGSVRIMVSRRVPLEGRQLQDYLLAAKEMKIKEEEEGKNDSDLIDVKQEDAALPQSRTASGALTRLASTGAGPASAVATAVVHNFKDVLIEGFVPYDNCAGPLFPFSAPAVEADEYGEAIDFAHFQVELPAEDATANGKGGGGGEEMDVEIEVDTRPTKVLTIGMTLQIRATVMLLDFEGKSDSYSMKTIIGNIGPRELVVVSGSKQAVQTLIQGVKSAGDLNKIYDPMNLQQVNISSASVSSLSMKMSDDLLGMIQLQKVGNYSIAWVQGKVEAEAKEEIEGSKEQADHVLVPLEKKLRTQHSAAFVGDFRMGDLRQDLVRNGISTELVQGVLVCDGLISIQRVGAQNEVVIQGPLSPKYYRVRSILYKQYQVCS